ncbi:MAG: T9SS type A sorting domain-containing protein [Flavipsychrobacter sp.]
MKKLQLLSRAALSFALLFHATTAEAQQWRLIEVVNQTDTPATSTSSYITQDSTTYSYSPTAGRGSSVDNDTIDYDEMIVYQRDANSLKPSDKSTRVYHSNNTLWAAAHFGYNTASSNWSVQTWDTLYYNSNKLYRKSTYTNLGSNMMEVTRDSFAYDGQGNVSFKETSHNMGVGSSLTPTFWYFYKYDANNNPIADSGLYYDNGWWETQFTIERMFNGSGKMTDLRTYSSLTGTGGKLELVSRRYYHYNGMGQLAIDSIQTYYLPTLTRDHEQRTYTYNGSGQLVSALYWKRHRTNNQTLDSQLVTISYTSYGRVEEVETTYYVSGSIAKKEKTRYKYEQYWPVAVKAVAAAKNELLLYPNPANHVLSISWKTASNVLLQGRIMNMQGQVVEQWTEQVNTPYQKQINTSALAAGNYYLELHAGAAIESKQFVIIK